VNILIFAIAKKKEGVLYCKFAVFDAEN